MKVKGLKNTAVHVAYVPRVSKKEIFRILSLFQRLLKSVKSKSIEKQGLEVKGSVRSILKWIDMSNRTVTLENGTKANTCSPALGYSFAAGTTDGPGEFDFTQG